MPFIVGNSIPMSSLSSLERLDDVIILPPFDRLSGLVKSHADMLIFPMGDKILIHAEYANGAGSKVTREIEEKCGVKLVLTDESIGDTYPHDILFNCLKVGKRIIGRLDCISEHIKEYAKDKDFELKNAKQGYAKCSACAISDNAVITSDPSIESVCKKCGIDVLMISKGNVTLPGTDYGFIGGASGMFGDTVLFCGDIRLHPDYDNIEAFCSAHDRKTLSLSGDSLFDVGTVFYIEKLP